MNRGFTLMELLVVIAITGILSSLTLASLKMSRDVTYEICAEKIGCIHTDRYTTAASGCTWFKDGEIEIKVCGDHIITRLNKNE